LGIAANRNVKTPKAKRKPTKSRTTSPKALLQQFESAIGQCLGFTKTEIKGKGFDAWCYDGMHDPPKIGRRYAKVLRRRNFECGFSENGFVVQVDLLDVPDDGLQAAVFVRSKDYPKGKNTANVTFKFRWDNDVEAYVVDFNAKDVRRSLQHHSALPPYVRPVPSKVGRAAIGVAIDASLAHNLLLLADFAAQVAARVNRVRAPQTFYPPLKRKPAKRHLSKQAFEP
jgi:hypothetical protein